SLSGQARRRASAPSDDPDGRRNQLFRERRHPALHGPQSSGGIVPSRTEAAHNAGGSSRSEWRTGAPGPMFGGMKFHGIFAVAAAACTMVVAQASAGGNPPRPVVVEL